MRMRTMLPSAFAVMLLLLGLTMTPVAAEETVVLACSVGTLVPAFPSAFVIGCDKSSGVPGVCSAYTGMPGEQPVSCAQTLAFFLSLPGYKLVSMQVGAGAFGAGPLYTIVGPTGH